MGDFPLMTDPARSSSTAPSASSSASSCARRASTSARSRTRRPAATLFTAKLIPNRGAWLEFETSDRGASVGQGRPQAQDPGHHAAARRRLRAQRGDRRRSSGRSTTTPSTRTSRTTLDKDPTNTQAEALIEFYKKLRPGDPPTGDNARQLIENLFFNFRRYDLGKVGRYKLNKKLDAVAARWASSCPQDEPQRRTITREDIAAIVGEMIGLNNGPASPRRHRPPGQPPRPRRRRADPERVPRRPPAHGARRQGAHDDPGARQGDAERPHQHPAGRGGDEGVLRRQPALASSWTRRTRWPS